MTHRQLAPDVIPLLLLLVVEDFLALVQVLITSHEQGSRKLLCGAYNDIFCLSKPC